MKTICFYARSMQNILFAKVGKMLEDENHTVCYLVQNSDEEKTIQNQGCKGTIYNLNKYLHENWNNQNILKSIELDSIEEKYDIGSLWSIFYSDRYLVTQPYERAIKFIKLHIAFFLDVIKFSRPRYFFNEEIAIFSSFIFYKIGTKHNCKYYGFSVPKQLGNDYVAIVENEKSNYFLLDKFYRSGNFSTNDQDLAKKFLKEFREKELIPPYLVEGKFSKLEPKFKISFIYKIIKFIVSVTLRRRNDYIDYMEFGNERYIYEIKNYFNYLRQKKYYQEPNFEENYLYFPLHYQPEASTLVNASNYEKQYCAVDLVAKKIPIGFKLYVKEHYSMLGHRDMILYKMLKKLPNVVFINPFADSHKLIKKSQGVIVLTGTAGWESILYGKPTFVLGNVFFNSFKYTFTIKNINDLSFTIKEALKNKTPKNKYDEELINYLSALFASLFEGYYYLNNQVKINNDNNVNKIFSIIKNLAQ